MASLAEIQAIVQRMYDELPALINRAKMTPQQIVIAKGLSDISERLGLILAGEFRAGNSAEPGYGFTGVRIGFPAFVYNAELWNIAAVENDVLNFGVRASDGHAIAGGGAVRLTSGGILVYNDTVQTGAIESDGDLKLGSDISDPGTTSLCVFTNDQTYNSEALGAGDLLIGDNSTGQPNILWDASASELLFRLGTIVTNRMSSSAIAASGVRLHRSTSQALSLIATNPPTAIQFDTEDYDDDSYADLVSDNTKITIPTGRAGRYEVGFYITIGNNATCIVQAGVWLNGLSGVNTIVSSLKNYTVGMAAAGQTDIDLAEGDYLQLGVVTFTSPGTFNLSAQGSAYKPAMWARRIR